MALQVTYKTRQPWVNQFLDFFFLKLSLVQPLQSYQVHGDNLLISQRRLSSNHSRPFQIFHTQPFILSNDVSDLVPALQNTYILTQGQMWPSNNLNSAWHPCCQLTEEQNDFTVQDRCISSGHSYWIWTHTWIHPHPPHARNAQNSEQILSCNPEVWGRDI